MHKPRIASLNKAKGLARASLPLPSLLPFLSSRSVSCRPWSSVSSSSRSSPTPSVSSPAAPPPSLSVSASLASPPSPVSVSSSCLLATSPFYASSLSTSPASFSSLPARRATRSLITESVSVSAGCSLPAALSNLPVALSRHLARCFSSSHLSRKLRLHQERASRGHIEYLRQLERPPTPSPFPLPPSPSPASPASAAAAKAAAFAEEAAAHTPEPNILVRSAEDWIKRDFFFPLSRQPDTGTAGEAARALERELCSPRKGIEGETEGDLASLLLTPEGPQYAGLLQKIELPGFGEINVVHGNLLAGDREGAEPDGRGEETPRTREEGTVWKRRESHENALHADALLVPVPPNFLPYRGFGLEVLERGGTALQKAAFIEVKQKLQQREAARDVLSTAGSEEGSQPRARHFNFSSGRVPQESVSESGLDPGDVILTPTFGVCRSVSLLAFLVTPYYWQGNSTEAARRLRFTMRRALAELNRQGPGSLLLPFVGLGLYGYEPRGAAEILIETAVEQLLQVDAVEPNYSLRKITFVDRDATNAALLAEAAQAAKRAWLPEHQVVPAPVYWSQNSRRLLDVTEGMLMFCRKHTRLSFKKHHGVIRRQKTHYFSNVRPFLWRASRVLEPPPLLLYKHSGATADWQLPARPFYRQGVSGMLFPPRLRRGFPSMRVNAKGQFVGVNKMPYIAEKAQPRL
ncbi:conserved hypothetical protein [Neospora caninum Liverpool]|uniref:Macro domain-containing protein n=1 Tax=Neospora caninum (strain Liverpool) TaxID=572307 RepID=F0VHR1_NEOCL|nr:conserved hypothetical protein [Neospora caninum Liverpool]CBZ53272.1 conserved hypothetical protein [Neospora caninum Liverpool]CEL67258.1 TPA: hypothetical protein BN1204_030590 [Neospora caninum Liverpool]|eukprot:XP_003883304.1 conserved hypothetical protein [Neospora caninum Liverpool]